MYILRYYWPPRRDKLSRDGLTDRVGRSQTDFGRNFQWIGDTLEKSWIKACKDMTRELENKKVLGESKLIVWMIS